ncbi:MAG: VCBS repeat-containing protein [Pirellulaceae bacterium]|nr:VCBS repeat-containing protein [Pirellulaceae bacterium]
MHKPFARQVFDAARSASITLATLVTLVCFGCNKPIPPRTPEDELATSDTIHSKAIDSEAIAAPTSTQAITSFCADCHLLPSSQSFGKERWHEEVAQGFRLYAKSGREDLVKPDFEATLAFFRNDAPDQLTFPKHESVKDKLFVRNEIPWKESEKPVQISHTRIMSPTEAPPVLTIADMWTGALFGVNVQSDSIQTSVLTGVSHPASFAATDLDGDEIQDYVVADLGTFNPENSNQASVWFLQGTESGEFKRRPIRLGLSRVAGIEAFDHDDDGDMDLVISDFGRYFVGSIYLATNQGNKQGVPQFDWEVLDSRPGAIETPIVDMNNDGKLDIVALVSQHYETVEVHLNLGDGKFETKLIYQADDPSYGSSGIEVADMDNDGDLDVVYTNGDTFDDTLAKPYHAVRWLENQGKYPFKQHSITSLPGVYCAVTGDIDLDGDLDIAAVSLLDPSEVGKQPAGTFDGVIWLEQTQAGTFQRHDILTDECSAATCRLIDWDQDGDLDLFVPPYQFDRNATDRLVVYLNQTK